MSYTGFMSKRPTRTAQETADFDRIVQIIGNGNPLPTEDDLTFLRVARNRIPNGPRQRPAQMAIDTILEMFA